MTELDRFRADKDRFFAADAHSPLTEDQKRSFNSLRYFPENRALRLKVAIEEFPTKEAITLQTTTGAAQIYTRFGRIKFRVEKQDVALTIFTSGNGFFLPFADSLAGSETYGAGRYLELEPLGKGKFLVDFNYAYNPYCAYNEAWSCPVTPAENRLKAPIRAGEKIFH
ncbi:MAG: DUF1684 domain-containing protein [Anaerolinea sp.]|jgi:uncharacterized protein (DUF1684 family)|nr:DUF1684 domain-containing protein [Anaerolinea sp.]